MGFLEVCLAVSTGYNETFNENCTNTEGNPFLYKYDVSKN
jgi:hypothetical protein